LVFACGTSCTTGYEVTTVLDATVTLSPAWQAVSLPESICCTRNEQEILLTVASPHILDPDTWVVRVADGTVAIPEIEIEDSRGTRWPLPDRAFWGGQVVFSDDEHPSPHREIRKIWARCNVPILISKIELNCFNHEEVKR
jgi:hypothetical protein